MKRIRIFIVFSLFSFIIFSCEDPMKGCVKTMMEEEGYSYDDAWEACEDGRDDIYN